MSTDAIKWNAHLQIRRWDAEQTREAITQSGTASPDAAVFDRLGLEPVTTDHPGNLLTTAGIGRIMTLVTAGTGNLIASTTARLGVGNGSTAAAIGDTDLSASAGSTNRWFQTGTVSIPANVLTVAATFGTADGNFVWSEWGIDVGTATVTSGATVNAVLLNRKVQALGTKAAGTTWSATATVTLS